MRRLGSLIAIVGVASSCTLSPAGSSGPTGGDGSSDRSRPALRCAPEEPDWSEVELLYADTEQSVHELITCGGLQVRIASNIVLMLIASNEDLFKDEERAFVSSLVVNPFMQAQDGTWSMDIGGSTGSTFALSFFEPDGGALVTEDVFDLDSYLSGVHIQTEVGFDEMISNPTRKHDFVFRWEAEGPLARLMNGGEPLPDGFTLQLSLSDFQSATPDDFGPFSSVFELEVESVVHYYDERDDTIIEYDVAATRDALGAIARSQSLGFDVQRIAASADRLALEGDTQSLTFVRLGELAGRIDYELSGDSVHILVTSDFGQGAAYPEAEWSCPSR